MDYNFEYEIDLHLYHPKDTKKMLIIFLDQALANKREIVKIIHGRGSSQRKLTVYKFLEKHPAVIAYGDDGPNWGATLVKLDLTYGFSSEHQTQ